MSPLVVSFEKLSAIIREHEDTLRTPTELPSRLVEIPIWYGDRWSRECAERYGVLENLSYLADINDTTVEEEDEYRVRRASRCCWAVRSRPSIPRWRWR